MPLAVAISGLARLGIWAQSAGQPPAVAVRGLDVPAVAVLGDYVYTDGGELSQLVDGQLPAGQPSYPSAWTPGLGLEARAGLTMPPQ